MDDLPGGTRIYNDLVLEVAIVGRTVLEGSGFRAAKPGRLLERKKSKKESLPKLHALLKRTQVKTVVRDRPLSLPPFDLSQREAGTVQTVALLFQGGERMGK
jgi:hypothetical protein